MTYRRRSDPDRVAYALFEQNWKIRRIVMFLALIYIGGHVSWIIFRGADTAVNQQLGLALVAAGVAIIGSYVFGAVWDDNDKRKNFAFDMDMPPRRPPNLRDEEDPLK